MCLAAYYPQYNQLELELDLLAEIKKLGVQQWEEMVKQEMPKGRVSEQTRQKIRIEE